MPFPPPTHGYEEQPIAATIDEYLFPKRSAIFPYKADHDLEIKSINKGDMLTIEVGRNPHDGCTALVEYEGDNILVTLHWHNGRWYARTDTRKGAVTEEMILVGVARALIKDQFK